MESKEVVEVLKKEINEYECVLALDDIKYAKVTDKDKELIKELLTSHKEACLALEREQNGVKCIGCGSVAKLKVCCNSCYQELKVKAEKLDRLEKWLEREIEVSTEVTENRCKEIITKAISRKRLDTLKEVREVLQNEKQ